MRLARTRAFALTPTLPPAEPALTYPPSLSSRSGPSSCPSPRARPLEATTFLAALGFTVLAAAALLAGPASDLAVDDAPLAAPAAAALVIATEAVR